MSDRVPPERPPALTFFGTITASVTHELSNVIAIINELGGLLDDMLALASAGTPVDLTKLRNVQDRLARQVARGDRIVRRLNRFAHSADHTVMQFDSNRVLDDLVRLTRRLTDLKKVELKADLPEQSVHLLGDPFAFQQAVFLCIGHLLAAGREGSSITVSTKGDADSATVEIEGARIERVHLDGTVPSVVSSLVESLKGRLEISPREQGQVFRLTFPSGERRDA